MLRAFALTFQQPLRAREPLSSFLSLLEVCSQRPYGSRAVLKFGAVLMTRGGGGVSSGKTFFGEVFGANSGNLQMSVIIDKILTVSSNKRKIPIRNKIVIVQESREIPDHSRTSVQFQKFSCDLKDAWDICKH